MYALKPEQLFFADEAVYSSRQSQRRVWAHKKTMVLVTARNQISFEAVAVVGAINVRGELVATLARQKSIDQFDFIAFLEHLRDRVPGEVQLYVVVDNLRVHRTLQVSEACVRLGVELVFNAPYSSEFNPIERCWAYSKRAFATDCLVITNFRSKPFLIKRVLKSMDDVLSASIEKHVRRCMHEMREWLVVNSNY